MKITKQGRIPNPGHQPGFPPAYLAERGVHSIVAGGMGRRAKMLFDEKQVSAIVGVSCSANDAVEGDEPARSDEMDRASDDKDREPAGAAPEAAAAGAYRCALGQALPAPLAASCA